MRGLFRTKCRQSLESNKLEGMGKHNLVDTGNLRPFLSALPITKPRTFSAASSAKYHNLHGGTKTLLYLVVRPNPGGKFTDEYLSRARPGSSLYIDFVPGPAECLVHDRRPLTAFISGSVFAPLRSLIQARLALHTAGTSGTFGRMAFVLAYREAGADVVEQVMEELSDAGLDIVYWSHNSKTPLKRVQDLVLDHIQPYIEKQIILNEANVFVCASKEAADNFAVNLEAVSGVPNIREALGERWIEEVFSY